MNERKNDPLIIIETRNDGIVIKMQNIKKEEECCILKINKAIYINKNLIILEIKIELLCCNEERKAKLQAIKLKFNFHCIEM